MEKKDLIELLNDIFIPFGFKRKGNNWVYNGKELAKIVNLQKSNFGNYFYINYGFIIRKLELTTTTHVEYRLTSHNKTEKNRIRDFLDFEISIPKEERLSELKEYILKIIVPNFEKINTEEDLLNELKSRSDLNDIPLVVREHFKLQ